jgi:hypothetical protein
MLSLGVLYFSYLLPRAPKCFGTRKALAPLRYTRPVPGALTREAVILRRFTAWDFPGHPSSVIRLYFAVSRVELYPLAV